jgi:hypothetical protein
VELTVEVAPGESHPARTGFADRLHTGEMRDKSIPFYSCFRFVLPAGVEPAACGFRTRRAVRCITRACMGWAELRPNESVGALVGRDRRDADHGPPPLSTR